MQSLMSRWMNPGVQVCLSPTSVSLTWIDTSTASKLMKVSKYGPSYLWATPGKICIRASGDQENRYVPRELWIWGDRARSSSLDSVQPLWPVGTVVQLFIMYDSVTPWNAAWQISLTFSISWSLVTFMSIESVMPSNRLILCRTLLLLPLIFLSIRVFSNESAFYIRWSKCWSFNSASVLPMNILGWFPLGLTSLIPCSPRDSQESSSTTVLKHQIFATQPPLWFSSHIHTWLLEKP